VCFPAAQCGQGPRSWRLSVMSVHLSVLKGSLPVDRLEQRLLSDGWQRSMWSCSAASARARYSALILWPGTGEVGTTHGKESGNAEITIVI
jgi:hypothetical protein